MLAFKPVDVEGTVAASLKTTERTELCPGNDAGLDVSQAGQRSARFA
jgi:hypothetical protein